MSSVVIVDERLYTEGERKVHLLHQPLISVLEENRLAFQLLEIW